jgi:hypothetical protein
VLSAGGSRHSGVPMVGTVAVGSSSDRNLENVMQSVDLESVDIMFSKFP